MTTLNLTATPQVATRVDSDRPDGGTPLVIDVGGVQIPRGQSQTLSFILEVTDPGDAPPGTPLGPFFIQHKFGEFTQPLDAARILSAKAMGLAADSAGMGIVGTGVENNQITLHVAFPFREVTYNVGEGAATSDWTIGNDAPVYGYRDPDHPDGTLGGLVPPTIQGRSVWEWTANPTTNLVILDIGESGGQFLINGGEVHVTLEGYGLDPGVILYWNSDNSRYESTAPAFAQYVADNVGNTLAVGFLPKLTSIYVVDDSPTSLEFTNLRSAPARDYKDYFSNSSSIPPSYDPATFSDDGDFPTGVTVAGSTGLLGGVADDADVLPGDSVITVIDTDGNSNNVTQPFTRVRLNDIYAVGIIADQDWIYGPVSLDTAMYFSNSQSAPPSYNAVSYSAVGLPTELNINTSTGFISGIIASTDTGIATVTATDERGQTANQQFNWTASDGIVPIEPEGTPPPIEFTNLRAAPVVDYNDYFSDEDSDPPSYNPASWSSANFPGGVSVNAITGLLEGTADNANITPGTGDVDVLDTEGNPASQQQAFTRVRLPAIQSRGDAPQQNWVVGNVVAYDVSVTFTDEATEGTYNAVSYAGAGLPTGLSVNVSTGVIEGTVGGSATSGSATVTATDEIGSTADSKVPWVTQEALTPIQPKGSVPNQFWTRNLDPGDLVMSMYFTNQANDGTFDPASYALTSGTLQGRSLNTVTGDITGAPTSTGTTTAVITVTDTDGNTAQQSIDITTLLPIAPKGTVPIQEWTVGEDPGTLAMAPYFTNTANDGTWDPDTYALESGSLYGRNLLTGFGNITGAPDTAGQGTTTIRVTDVRGNTADQSFSVKSFEKIYAIGSVPAQNWDENLLITPLEMATYFSNDGESPPSWNPVSYSMIGAPDGVTINTGTGQISGTPTADGSGTITVTVTDDKGWTAQQGISWSVLSDTSAADWTVATDGDERGFNGALYGSLVPETINGKDAERFTVNVVTDLVIIRMDSGAQIPGRGTISISVEGYGSNPVALTWNGANSQYEVVDAAFAAHIASIT